MTVRRQTAAKNNRANLGDRAWIALHVPRYKKVRERYLDYEAFLKGVLQEACRRLAPMAIVQARAKALGSFAEKILRKRALYSDPKLPQPPNPLVRMTDLCGGRVITQTAQQVEQICAFIKEAFEVDWANSEDVSQRLRPTEFGYRSVHYIVSPNAQKLRAAGIMTPVPPSIVGLRAEIQVRTLLEHASAEIGHDTLYKSGMIVPDAIRREFAALAAVLEGADREFGRLLASLNELKSHFGAWHRSEEVQQEMERLQLVLNCDPRNQELAVKIGQLALAIGRHQTALAVLEPFQGERHRGVQRLRGIALTEMHWATPAAKAFGEGIEMLEAACSPPQADAESLCALAECWAHRGDDEKASEYFRKAIVVDPTEPLSFCRFVEFEVARQRNDAMIRLTEPIIQRVMTRCRSEIQAGVNLPIAWSCLAVFQLLTGKPFDALQSLAQVLTLCGKPESESSASSQACAAGRALQRTRETVKHLSCIREKLTGFDWFERLLLLALAVRVRDAAAFHEVRALATWRGGQPHLCETHMVVILSGGCAAPAQAAVELFRPIFRRAVQGLAFTLISGGTRRGVSGVAGDVAQRSAGRIRAFGYLPSRLPVGIQADTRRFARLFESQGKDFTPLDSLQGWIDLVAAGVKPSRVKLLSYAGGQIARAEYAVALALGARVGVIEATVVPAERRFNDPLWQHHPNLIRLPLDAMTLRAFLHVDAQPLTEPERRRLESAARLAHEDYMKSATPEDPSLQPWNDLNESLKLSNYHQVAYWERVLREHGLGVRKLTRKNHLRPGLSMDKVVGEAGIRKLAEIEHGRWNVERLSYGWRFAEKKDVLTKRSPYLVPWREIPREIQKYDVDAIRGLPKKLREAGLELYRLQALREPLKPQADSTPILLS